MLLRQVGSHATPAPSPRNDAHPDDLYDDDDDMFQDATQNTPASQQSVQSALDVEDMSIANSQQSQQGDGEVLEGETANETQRVQRFKVQSVGK